MRHASLNLKDALAAAEKVYCCWRQRLLVHFVYQGGYHLRRRMVMHGAWWHGAGWQLGAMVIGHCDLLSVTVLLVINLSSEL